MTKLRSQICFILLLGCLWVTGQIPLWAQTMEEEETGVDCEHAIRVTQDFQGVMPEPGVYWYKVWTYDLPLRIAYNPWETVTTAPTAVVDLTCDPGHYPTDELQDMFGLVDSHGKPNNVYTDLPVTLRFVSGPNGSYTLSVSSSYREMMFRNGISEDVWVYVKVTVSAPATVGMVPSTDFRDCVGEGMENWTKYGDTISVSPETSGEDFYIFPYSLWRKDSVRFVWTGEEPVELWMGKDCGFEADPTNEFFLDYIVIDPEESNTYKYSVKEINDFIQSYIKVVPDGLFYVRIISEGSGQLIVEQIPEVKVDERATLLEIDQVASVRNGNQLFYFPTEWSEAIKFISPTDLPIVAYFGTSSDFPFDAADASCLSVMPFAISGVGGHELALSAAQLSAITSQAVGDFVYVRFVCNESTTVMPKLWDNECALKITSELHPMDVLSITARRSSYHRLRVTDFTGYDLTISWTGSVLCPVYVGDTCSFVTSDTKHVIYSADIPRANSITISSTEINSWLSRADEDGFVYFLVNSPTRAGELTFGSEKPQETPPDIPDPEPEVIDPIYPETPEPEWTGTIRLACEEENVMRVEVSEEQELLLYEVRDHNATTPRPVLTLVEQWTQAPTDTPHVLMLEAEHTYMLKGQDATIRIRR